MNRGKIGIRCTSDRDCVFKVKDPCGICVSSLIFHYRHLVAANISDIISPLLESTVSHLNFNPSGEIAIKHALIGWRANTEKYRLDKPSLMTGHFLMPASNWNPEHMLAFHMIPILNVDLRHVIPVEYVPSDITEFNLFWRLTRDDIYDQNYRKLYHSDSPQDESIQGQIAVCIGQLMQLVERRTEYDSDLSSTSNEGDKLEGSSTAFAASLCKMFLRVLGLKNKHPPSWDYTDKAAFNIQIIPGVTGNVRADGVILFTECRQSKRAAVWIEVNPSKYAPRNKTDYQMTLPQKAAEALAVAQSRGLDHESDQEVFGIEFSHRFAAIWHAIFPAAYLTSLQTDTSLPAEQYVLLKRSKVFDLVESSDRFQFAQNMIGMMKYLSSGKVKIVN